ncbi:hypothetical protein [Streptomyces sp. NPDC005423]|uniref:hypothetical protein n=1 Tax=Streptomyces sp. NPDC005423 TaxID=3155343 RepID=UPI0033A1F24A
MWVFLGLAGLQAVTLVPIIGRLRGLDSAVRSKARLDLLDAVGNLLFLGGLFLQLEVAESWFWLAVAGIALMAAVHTVKSVRRLRVRRRRMA